MSRLLFAAARGARTQALMDVQSTCQCMVCGATTSYGSETRADLDRNSLLVVHPEDAHLAYGPISTALRERAEWGGETEAGIPYIHGFFDFTGNEDSEFVLGGEFNRSLFLLILAEALADEGL